MGVGVDGITHVFWKEKEKDVTGGPYAGCFLVSRVSVCAGRGLREESTSGALGVGGDSVTLKVE